MRRSRPVLASGIAAGIAANYWVLEGPLADRTDATGGWISDLGARSESSGWIFDLLDFSSGALLLVFALLIRQSLASRSRALRWGVGAMIVAALCSMVDGAIPLSCAESLPGSCELSYDGLDLIHGAETFLSIGATAAMFGFLALGFADERDPALRRLSAVTAAAGAAWILCNVMMGAQYVLGDLESVRGVFHRLSQVALGGWLIALAIGVSGPAGARGAKPSPGLGRIDGDGEAAEQIRMP
jgi:Protein of unknown function (DUF998)